MTHLPQIVHRLVQDPAFRACFRERPVHTLAVAGWSLDAGTLRTVLTLIPYFDLSPHQLRAAVAAEAQEEWAAISAAVASNPTTTQ